MCKQSLYNTINTHLLLTHAVIISSLWLTSCLKGGDGWLPRVLLCVWKGTIDRCCRWFQSPFVDLPMKAQLHGS